MFSFATETHKAWGSLAMVALIVLGALYLATLVLSNLKAYRFIGSGTTSSNTIQVSGEGEVFSVPAIAEFTVGVSEEAKDVKAAQSTATKKGNDIIEYLKGAGIESKDIQTTEYSVQPAYDWVQPICKDGVCPNGQNKLRGFTVAQTLRVKVRNADKAGEVLAGVGGLGVNNVSGLNFISDDEEKLKADARQKAIEKARIKADELAQQLGVKVVRVVGFSESGGGQQPVMYAQMRMEKVMDAAGSAPSLPAGQNKIQSNVTITYEIQ